MTLPAGNASRSRLDVDPLDQLLYLPTVIQIGDLGITRVNLLSSVSESTVILDSSIDQVVEKIP